MVEEELGDGKRIAQLLASEITGRSTGPLGSMAVVDADADATPSEDGTVAYRVAVNEDRLATVRIEPARAVVALQRVERAVVEDAVETTATDALAVRSTDDGTAPAFAIENGAAVKGAVDVLAAVAEQRDSA